MSGPGLFTVEATPARYLPAGEDTVHAVVTLRAAPDLPGAPDRAEVVVIDVSSSMSVGRKMRAAKAAARAAVDCMEDGVRFAVIVGNREARQVWPPETGQLCVAGPMEREGARRAIRQLQPDGGTVIGRWLDLARELLEPQAGDGLGHVVLLSDGKNEHQTHDQLREAAERCRGVLQCDCWGVGTDWEVAELRFIADALLGRETAVVDIDELQGEEALVASFRDALRASQARVAPGVRLRVVTWDVADLQVLEQASPRLNDLTDLAERSASNPGARECALGGWAPDDVRSYFLALKVRPDHVGAAGDEMRVARVEAVLGDGTVAGSAVIAVTWTDDSGRLTANTEGRDAVGRYRRYKQIEQGTQAGVAASRRADAAAAQEHFRWALEAARELGDQGHVERLSKLVDAGNPPKGDLMEADTYSNASEPFPLDRRGEPRQPGAGDAPATGRPGDESPRPCPRCGYEVTRRFCEQCGLDTQPDGPPG
jgi:von Willebrand factor type A domain